jgi:hypothetical protein
MLLAAMTVATGALPAGAAPQAAAAAAAMTWETVGGSVLQPEWSVSACLDDFDAVIDPGQTVVIQIMLGGTWVTKQEVVVQQAQARCVDVTPSKLAPGPGSYYFRALTRQTPSSPLIEGGTALTLERAASEVWLVDDQTELYSMTTTPNRAVLVAAFPLFGQTVDLQRKAGNSWIGVSRGTVGADSGGRLRVPVPTRAGLSRYRLVVRSTVWNDQSISASFTMHQTDGVKHRSYIAAARRYMARFCPSNPISIDTKYVQGTGQWGVIGYAVSHDSSSGDRSSGRIETRIDLRSGLPPAQLRHTALHECAHALQNRAYVEGKQDAERAHARKLWPRVGVEGEADCMAYYLTRKAYWLGYVRSCTSTQLADAKRMWRTYGGKYQANPYIWGDPDAASAAAGASVDVVERSARH